jgi:hypothetical protein
MGEQFPGSGRGDGREGDVEGGDGADLDLLSGDGEGLIALGLEEEVAIKLEDYLDKVRDTQYLAGAEAYAVCLIYYKILEAAAKAGIAGAAERYNRLKVRFEGQGGPGTPTPPAP